MSVSYVISNLFIFAINIYILFQLMKNVLIVSVNNNSNASYFSSGTETNSTFS